MAPAALVAFLALIVALATGDDAPSTCAALGCSVHKEPARSCQCNFHCGAHKDCCSDYAVVCPNQTDPLEARPVKAPSNATKHSGSSKADKADKAKHSSAHSAPSSPHPSRSNSSHATRSNATHTGSAKGGGQHTAAASAGSSSSSDSSTSSTSTGTSTSSKPEHTKEKTHDHTKGGSGHGHQKQSTYSLLIVLLACATGITLPVTVSIILVLRSRGVCCVSSSFQRIDLPPTKPTDTPSDVGTAPPPTENDGAAAEHEKM